MESKDKVKISTVTPFGVHGIYAQRVKEFIPKLLESLLDQTLDKSKYEIILVSEKDDNISEKLLAKYLENSSPQIKLYKIDELRAGPKRNHGAKMARGEYVLFLDDDMIASPNLLKEHLDFHKLYKGSVLGYFNSVLLTDNVKRRREKAFLEFLNESGDQNIFKGETGDELSYHFFYTGNVSVRRDAFLNVGGFDQGFELYGVEDIDLGYRLYTNGEPLYLNKKALTEHLYTPNMTDYARKRKTAGYSLGYFINKYRHLYNSFHITPKHIIRVFIRMMLYVPLTLFSYKALKVYIAYKLRYKYSLGFFQYFIENRKEILKSEETYLR